jgi:hypothetical protein
VGVKEPDSPARLKRIRAGIGERHNLGKEIWMLSDVSTQNTPGAAKLGGLLNWSLLRPRQRFQFGALEAVVLAIYTALVAWTEAHHIPWADEAQAWLIARDSSLREIFTVHLRYEGSPGLWHFLLWILSRLHVSYAGMHWIALVFPIAGMAVFLRYAPFPTIIRIITPFSFYFLYQYAVVARSYMLIPLLVFTAAALMARPARNMVWLAIVLGLLSNLCAHGFLISVGFACMIAVRLWKVRGQSDKFLTRQRVLASAACLGAFWLFAVWSAAPTHDNRYMPDWDPVYVQEHKAERARQAAAIAAQQKAAAVHHFRGYNLLTRDFYFFRRRINAGLSNSWVLSVILLCVIAYYLATRRNILDFTPFLLLQLLFWFVIGHSWHMGTVLIALIGVLWIDWPRSGEPHEPAWRGVLTLTILILVVEQCTWSVHAIHNDITAKYSGDRDAAEFLSSHLAGKKIAGFQYHCVGVLAYFPNNIFFNQPGQAFWRWSRNSHVDDRVQQTLAQHPDYIDVGFAVRPHPYTPRVTLDPGWIDRYMQDTEEEILITGRYRETHRFCGIAFSGHDYDEGECQAILEPVAH